MEPAWLHRGNMKKNKEVFDKEVLEAFAAREQDMGLLLEYVANPMQPSSMPDSLTLPLEDEPFAATWKEYAQEAKQSGFLQALQKRLIQLNFPVREGMSQDPDYQAAVKTGRLPEQLDTGPLFVSPEKLKLFVHESPAGSIGVLLAGARQDLATLVQTLLHKNEPISVPDSLGAFMVSGYNNWDRIRNYKQAWMESQGDQGNEFSWMLEFEQLRKNKELYQDRFIILSSGPYSNIPAHDLGLDPESWRDKSTALRLEHECTHYFTRRVFSSMQKNLWDEIFADYMGITAAQGSFSARWFLMFMGLENYPEYRPGGRFEKYVPDSLPESALEVLRSMTFAAAEHLHDLDQKFGPGTSSMQDRSVMLLALCITGWSALAGPNYLERFTHVHRQVSSRLQENTKL